jgi:hypothetical protein
MEMGDRIGRNFIDHSANSRFIPSILRKWTMTPGSNHDLEAPDILPLHFR